jgi:hypothetical protein
MLRKGISRIAEKRAYPDCKSAYSGSIPLPASIFLGTLASQNLFAAMVPLSGTHR